MDKQTHVVHVILCRTCISDSECVDESCVLLQDVADPLFAHCRLHADKRTTASRVINVLCLLLLLYSFHGDIHVKDICIAKKKHNWLVRCFFFFFRDVHGWHISHAIRKQLKGDQWKTRFVPLKFSSHDGSFLTNESSWWLRIKE